ncbi:Glutathione transferase protein [Dioscorea alata]|uniref:Glutathione transferase protein n=1 Tax=Dioscorea alata TaxID=55571 RepID=A0ACB7V6K0_DIOAL|nr:Glutathione transferase protein [Dioscorea alata]
MGSVTVFGLPASTDVARVLACLFEKDVEFQLVRIDTYKGNHKVPEFLKLQDCSGQVTFKDGKTTLTNSREICRYVCTEHADSGNKNIFGTGALERATIEQWLQAETQNFDPPSSDLVFQLAFAVPLGLIPDQTIIANSEKKLAKLFDVYDRRLAESEFLAGDEFTIADLSHLPNSQYIVTKSEKGRELFKKRKNVHRWWNAISSRDSWKKVVEMQQEHPGLLEKFTY